MNRFHVTFDVLVGSTRGDVGVDRVEWFTDRALELLGARPELVDPDAGATLASGSIEFMTMVDAASPEDGITMVGKRLRDYVADVLGADDGADLRVGFLRASAVESASVRAGS